MHRSTLTSLVMLLSVATVATGDWPQILGPNRDGKTSGETIPSWTSPPQVNWRAPCGAGYAGVAVSKGNVLLWHREGNKEVLDCLAAVDGRQRWQVSFDAVYRGGVDADLGPRSVPLIDRDRDRVYVYGAAGDLHAVSLTDGSTVWSRELRAEHDAEDGYFGAGSTPIVIGDLLISVIGGRNNAGLIALDTRDGKTRWTAIDEAASYASPVTMVINGEVRLIAVLGLSTVLIDPVNGKLVREFDFGRRGPTVNAATPLVDGVQLFVTASYGIGCRMLDMSTDPPKDLWTKRDVISSQYVTPVRHGDFLYAISGREDTGDAGLSCVRWSDGQVAWSRPGFGTAHLIATGDRILAQGTQGRLALMAAEPREYRELAVADLPAGTYRSLPALADGILYCRRTISASEGELLALKLNP